MELLHLCGNTTKVPFFCSCVCAQNLVEGVELLHVRGVRACLQQQTINELSERVEALQVRLTAGEAALARENPPVFHCGIRGSAVQVCRCFHTVCTRVPCLLHSNYRAYMAGLPLNGTWGLRAPFNKHADSRKCQHTKRPCLPALAHAGRRTCALWPS
eukprot:scaffold105062_cov16-Tisochrysis_lutea.AAC.1